MASQTGPPSRPRGTLGHIVGLAIGMGLVFAVAVAGGIALMTHKNFLAVLTSPVVQTPQQVFGKNNLLVLVEGLDYDYNPQDQESSAHSRSDVIWAVNMDFGSDKIYKLSVPRDMDAILPNGKEAKINQAQSDGGVTEAQSVIAKFLGVPGFDRYILLRAETTTDLINAVGGVDVNVQNSDPADKSMMSYDDSWGHLHIHLKPGFQHLSGDQAVGYMRFRHDFCGDPCRIKRQDQVLKALVARLKGDKLNTMLHAGVLLAVFNKDVTTNFTKDEELALVNAFLNLSPSDVKTAQVPYVDTKQLSYAGEVIVPDENVKNKLVQNMLLNPPQPRASPAGVAPLANVTPATVKVDVQNGTGIPGLAKRISEKLRTQGFKIGDVGNAPSAGIETTQVHQHSPNVLAAEKVKQALASPSAAVVNDAHSAGPKKSDVTVVIGRDLAAYPPQASAIH
ncbi:MAG: LCP family protein [Candidatus Eremiobacteraeota bacterium]|nr:LCP family protein [Candidatus Eremiobacteraeota bacterium]